MRRGRGKTNAVSFIQVNFLGTEPYNQLTFENHTALFSSVGHHTFWIMRSAGLNFHEQELNLPLQVRTEQLVFDVRVRELDDFSLMLADDHAFGAMMSKK